MRTVFSDDVVSAEDLKRRQRYWLERARKRGGVTIAQGKLADLVLAPRQLVAAGTQAAHHAQLAGQFFLEMFSLRRPPGESVVFPWLKHLEPTDQQAFIQEYTETLARCASSGQWQSVDEVLEDWQATAEAHCNPELLDAWQTRGNPDDYVPIEKLNGR